MMMTQTHPHTICLCVIPTNTQTHSIGNLKNSG